MRKVLKDSGRPCAEKTVSPKLTVVGVFVFWTFKYLQEIFVQFWVQHGHFGLHVFVQHQGEDGKHGVDGGVPEDVSHCLPSGPAAKRTITGATTFPFSPSWISTELKHRGNAREEQQPRALGQPGLIPACISPDRQESLVERHRSEVENGGEDSLGTHRGDTRQGGRRCVCRLTRTPKPVFDGSKSFCRPANTSTDTAKVHGSVLRRG